MSAAAQLSADAGGTDESHQFAANLVWLKRRRQAILGTFAAEPAWEILLLLFSHRGTRLHSISSLGRETSVPFTTAHRWIRLLEQGRLTELRPDPNHANRIFVALSAHGSKLIEACLAPRDSVGP